MCCTRRYISAFCSESTENPKAAFISDLVLSAELRRIGDQAEEPLRAREDVGVRRARAGDIRKYPCYRW